MAPLPIAVPKAATVGAFLLRWHLPLGLALGVLLGFAWPPPGTAAKRWGVSSYCIALIFLLSGLKLKTSEIRLALSAKRAAALGAASILLLTPCLAFAMIRVPLVTEFAAGAAVFLVMPTTLSSGVVLAEQAHGNVPLALLLTTSTNLLAVATVPFSTSLLFSSAAGGLRLDPVPMLVKLLLTILLPLAVGKAAQLWPPVAPAVSRHRTATKLAASFLLVLVPWMNVSASAGKLSLLDAGQTAALFGLGAAAHAVYLAVNAALCWAAGVQGPQRRSVIILASQKTLPVAVAVIDFLPGAVGAKGLMVIPCIVFHFTQICIDACIAANWARHAQVDVASSRKALAEGGASGDGEEGVGVDGKEEEELELAAADQLSDGAKVAPPRG